MVVLLSAVAGLPVGSGSPSGAATPAPLATNASDVGPCPGALAPVSWTGAIIVDGGTAGANATAGVPIGYTYFVQVASTSGPPVVGCFPFNGSAVSNASGGFSFSPAIPASGCGGGANGSCLAFSGPFGPVSATLAGPAPPGYAVAISESGSEITITWVSELQRVTLAPGGTTETVSPGAPTAFRAEGWEANGTPTPLQPTYFWTLLGSGWSFVGPATGSRVTVIALAGAGIGNLSVQAVATVPGGELDPPPAAVTLAQVPTAVQTGELRTTTGDVGSVFPLTLLAVGAGGYPYWATITPGLGAPSANVSCTGGPGQSGPVMVHCATNLTYAAPGTAQPTAIVTNGYSAGPWQFPSVTVAAFPSLTVSPDPPAGYALAPVPVTVIATNGTGTMPFARACLALPFGAPVCDPTPGPRWAFAPVFNASGAYLAVAWAIDADGANGSAAFTISVVAPLSLGPIGVDPASLTVDAPVTLRANLSGGDLPARFWWNASDTAGPLLAGSVTADGPMSLTFVPPTAGAVSLSLTVVDALGTYAQVDRIEVVGPPQAVAVVPVTVPPALPVVAGTPVPVSWQAVDPSGDVVRSFSAAGAVTLSAATDGPVSVWVNASGLGALSSLGNGSYGLPPTAWIGGTLSLTITPATAGVLSISLEGAAFPGAAATLALTVDPDRAHLTLFDPAVAEPGSRSNATFWRVLDRFGNPAPGAVVTVRLSFGATAVDALVVVGPGPLATSGVWVNFTAPDAGGGSVTVIDAAGDVLAGPFEVPPLAPAPIASAPAVTFAAAVPVGVTGALLANIVARRTRRRTALSEPDESELQALAEGRAQVVEIVRRAGSVDLEAIEAAWDRPPAPAALTDWLASLVADGTLGATLGPDGRARFCLAEGPAPSPRVTLDPEALDRALRGREIALDEGVEDQDGSRPTRS